MDNQLDFASKSFLGYIEKKRNDEIRKYKNQRYFYLYFILSIFNFSSESCHINIGISSYFFILFLYLKKLNIVIQIFY